MRTQVRFNNREDVFWARVRQPEASDGSNTLQDAAALEILVELPYNTVTHRDVLYEPKCETMSVNLRDNHFSAFKIVRKRRMGARQVQLLGQQ